MYMPVSGEVVEINPKLEDAPETVNEDPYGEGWMIKVKVSDAGELEELMSADDYKKEVE
jgi:glycine cleavage system H protein